MIDLVWVLLGVGVVVGSSGVVIGVRSTLWADTGADRRRSRTPKVIVGGHERRRNGEALGLVLLSIGLYFVAVALALALDGPAARIAASALTLVLGLACMVIVAVRAAAGRRDRRAIEAGMLAASSTVPAGVHPALFAPLARDRLERADYLQADQVLVQVDLDLLDELRIARGAVVASAAVDHMATVVRRSVPAGALVGAIRGDRLWVLLEGDAVSSATLAQRLRLAVSAEPFDPDLGFRATITVAMASTDRVGFGYDDLVAALATGAAPVP